MCDFGGKWLFRVYTGSRCTYYKNKRHEQKQRINTRRNRRHGTSKYGVRDRHHRAVTPELGFSSTAILCKMNLFPHNKSRSLKNQSPACCIAYRANFTFAPSVFEFLFRFLKLFSLYIFPREHRISQKQYY